MDSESRVLSILLELGKIACSLGAFVGAMVLAASWKMHISAFFNVTQLIVLVYAMFMLVIRIMNEPNSNLWKIENIVSMVLASLELAAASVWVVNIPDYSPAGPLPPTTAFFNMMYSPMQTKKVESDVPAMISMVAFGYITGIICFSHAAYVTLTN